MNMRTVHRLVAALAALVCAAALAAPASAARWNVETLDGDIENLNGRDDEDTGRFNATVVWNGTPHVFYRDVTNENLRHAWWSSVAWFYETLDGDAGPNGRVGNAVGEFTAATVWNNTPHVFYYDDTDGDLRHAWWTGTTWLFEDLDGTGGADGRTTNTVGADAAVTVWNNQPHVWYFDGSAGDLRHAWWTGTRWQFETLDGATVGPNGRVNATVGEDNAVSVWNGTPHVFYRDSTNADLRHAWWTGAAWFFETLDGAGGTNGRVTNATGADTAVTVWNNEPHVWYQQIDTRDLRHAWWNGTAWFFETLDGAGGTNGRIDGVLGYDSAVTVWNATPHVFYGALSSGDLRHGWWTGSAWQFEVLDGFCTTLPCTGGRTTDIVGSDNAVVVWNSQPHVWYRNTTAGDLRHTWYG